MTMEYKGYLAGPIDFDPEDRTFSGIVAGLKDVIHFEGSTADELYRSFHESIDDYLALCAEKGQEPDRSFSGNFPVRVDPELHRKAALQAASRGMSLNQWIAHRIEAA